MVNKILQTPPAVPDDAQAFFAANLAFETDCSDVHESLTAEPSSVVLLDVRGPVSYAKGHVPGAVNLAHWDITQERLGQFPEGSIFVVYCAGPHCNGADKGGLKIASHGYRVKKMIGGMTGWTDEGFATVTGTDPGRMAEAPPVAVA